MQELIIDFFKKEKKDLSFYDIKNHLIKIKSFRNIELTNELKKMVEQNLLDYSAEKYSYLDPSVYELGKINVNPKGFGFITKLDDNTEFFVAGDDLNQALDQDEVIFKIKPKLNNKFSNAEARVIKISKRKKTQLVGVCQSYPDGKKFLKINNPKFQDYKTSFVRINFELITGNLYEVQIIKVIKKNILLLQPLKDLGASNLPGSDILSVVYENDILTDFNPESLKETGDLPDELTIKDVKELKGRTDLTQKNFVTIDGDGSKDFDDAILVEKLENGNHLLYVSIADVTHYVTRDSALRKDALNRGCSVYLLDRVIPMLPEKLSNGLCSLNPDKIRLTMTCQMEINKKGEIVNHKIYESYIKSHARLTYKNVNTFFNSQKLDNDPAIKDMLKETRNLYYIIRDYKINKGVLDFDIPEPEFILENNKVVDIKVRERGEAEKLIEEFMVIANEAVTLQITKLGLPFLYRVHDKPSEEKILNLITQLKLMGVNAQLTTSEIVPKDISNVLAKLQQFPNKQIIFTLFLRSMEKAKYSTDNIGHFGLSSDNYTHFTSPIRRYPDVLVHQYLKDYLIHKVKYTDKQLSEIHDNLEIWADKSNINANKAVDCERAVNAMKMAEYMEDHIGEEHDALITAVKKFGIFAALPNSVEGLIHISELKNDYYVYDERTSVLRGERTKKSFIIGQNIKIRVKGADKKTRKIDFELIN
ncbi:ribonuclease R [Spiroplasma endosymbiont of Amphibalanus improvisus]|uniref:ribonuclease R n=1 Tax=Spiroplasma endosymbiont of Amphibalanus improvisus TaxID=3066327 RepID=UPI00313DA85E